MQTLTKIPKKTLSDHLSNYAAYHRDRRNIATHFVGIPMIVLGVSALLSRPAVEVAGLPLSPAVLAIAGTIGFYLRLDARFAALMTVLMGLSGWFGAAIAAASTGVWLAGSLGLFVLGWAIQFLGHFFEGRKPAFVDDLIGLLVGPLFIVAETVFALGMRAPLAAEIVERAGPTRVGKPLAAVTPIAQASSAKKAA